MWNPSLEYSGNYFKSSVTTFNFSIKLSCFLLNYLESYNFLGYLEAKSSLFGNTTSVFSSKQYLKITLKNINSSSS
jgi:hypothetical protein